MPTAFFEAMNGILKAMPDMARATKRLDHSGSKVSLLNERGAWSTATQSKNMIPSRFAASFIFIPVMKLIAHRKKPAVISKDQNKCNGIQEGISVWIYLA